MSHIRARASVRVEKGSDMMQDMMAALKEDLSHLFDEQGIDPSLYDDPIEFKDPITSYSSAAGYAFNIKLLKVAFDPTFTLHDMRLTGEHEITTRWTMTMAPTFTPFLPAPLRKVWQPSLTFTGLSVMTVNPDTRRFNSHIDIWDNLNNNEYLSLEGVLDVFGQLANTKRIPADLDSPEYMVLKRKKDYEIRRYAGYVVAEVSQLPSQQASSEGGKDSAFGTLAGYLFGGNSQSNSMDMTTPVYTASSGSMQFVVDTSPEADPEALPTPNDESVRRVRVPGRIVAAYRFSGVADPTSAVGAQAKLRSALQRDAVQVEGDDWELARYNDPSTSPQFRTNEVLIPLNEDALDLWTA